MSKIGTALKLATGLGAAEQFANSMKGNAAAIKGIADATRATVTDPAFGSIQSQMKAISDGTHPACGGVPAKYKVYSHTKNFIFFGDDFGDCLDDAYTHDEQKRLIKDRRSLRRIQAYGSAVMFAFALFFGLKSANFLPLFYVFPSMWLLSLALRRGAQEQTLIKKEPIGIARYFELEGAGGLWK
jgi:hypothetical protein